MVMRWKHGFLLILLAGAIVYELTFSPWSIPNPEGAWIEYAIRQLAWLYAFVLCGLALAAAWKAKDASRAARAFVGGCAGLMLLLAYYAFTVS